MDPVDSNIKNYLSNPDSEVVPPELVAKAKKLFSSPAQKLSCPHCGKAITPFKSPLSRQRIKNVVWAFLALACFGGSFLAPKYFFQFLAAFIFFGFRWILDQRATKTQIFVYKSLREGEASESKGRDLHQPSSHL